MLVVFYIGSMLYVQNDRTNSCKCIFPVKKCTLFVMDSVRRDSFKRKLWCINIVYRCFDI